MLGRRWPCDASHRHGALAGCRQVGPHRPAAGRAARFGVRSAGVSATQRRPGRRDGGRAINIGGRWGPPRWRPVRAAPGGCCSAHVLPPRPSGGRSRRASRQSGLRAGGAAPCSPSSVSSGALWSTAPAVPRRVAAMSSPGADHHRRESKKKDKEKMPRTLSTSILRIKHRSPFWEKFWSGRGSSSARNDSARE